MKIRDLLGALARMPPSEKVYFVGKRCDTGVQIDEVVFDPAAGGVVLLSRERVQLHHLPIARCPQCGARAVEEDVGTTCRCCFRGVVEQETQDGPETDRD
jgi:hypothetical protein